MFSFFLQLVSYFELVSVFLTFHQFAGLFDILKEKHKT